jgi:hypothetical protein
MTLERPAAFDTQPCASALLQMKGADACSVTCRTTVASGVPSSQESERCGQLRRQNVLDHDPGAKVAFDSERQIAAQPGSGPLRISPEQRLEGGRPLRDRLAQIEGCCPEPRLRDVFCPGLIVV